MRTERRLLLCAEMIFRLRLCCALFTMTVLAGCSSNASPNAVNKAQSGDVDSGPVNSAPTSVQFAPTADSIFQAEPTIAIAPNGTVAVAWLDVRSASAPIGYAFSKDRGDTWSDPQILDPGSNGYGSNEILVADAQSNFYLVTLALKAEESANSVVVAKAAAGQTTFGAPVVVSDSSSALARDASALSIAQDQSLVVDYIEYADTTYAKAVVVSARSTDGGATWKRTTITPSGKLAWTNGCASRTSGKVAAVFLNDGTQMDSIRWSDDNGATWPEANETDISPDENPGEFPSCVADGNDLWFMQGTTTENPTAAFEPTLDAIKLSHSTDGGHTFPPFTKVQDPAAGTSYMRALATVQGDGSLSLVYYAGSGDNDKAATLRRAISTDRGQTFSPSEELYSPITLTTSRAGNDWLGDLLGATSDSKNTFVAFVDNASGASHVRFTRLTP